MEKIKTYLIHWIGPFVDPNKVKDLELKLSKEFYPDSNDKFVFELYLLKGKIPYAKKSSYYCGESLKQGAGKRLKNDKHHINDYDVIEEIWAGYISNIEPISKDVFAAEKIITAYLKDEVGEGYILNETNKKFPKYDICIVNRWYKHDSVTIWEKLKQGSPSKITPSILLHYTYGKEHEIFGSERIKRLKYIVE